MSYWRPRAGRAGSGHDGLFPKTRANQTQMKTLTETTSTLASFVKANNDRDIDSGTACFSKDAIVYDDGQIMRGVDEIREWIAQLFRQFQYVVAPTKVRELTNGAVLTATITGNFPGGQVSLDYHCRSLGDKIDVMVILPSPVAK